MSAMETPELERLWKEKPDVIRGFIEKRPQHEQLVSEICYILKRHISNDEIEVASISGRAKTLKSFAEKIIRKEYDDPLSKITDLAGVRCVFLYLSDRSKIENIITKEFEIKERIDKIEEKAEDEFGYGALHFLVKLGKNSSGARYDDLKELTCEIQVRTVLQDAWAIIDHHLIYKREKDAPKQFRRKLNSLSGLFETADSQFEQLKQEREKYISEIENKSEINHQELNLDTLVSFLKHEIPSKSPGPGSALSNALAQLLKHGHNTIRDLQRLFERTAAARTAIRRAVPTPVSISEVSRAIALTHEPSRLKYASTRVREHLVKNLHLVLKEEPKS